MSIEPKYRALTPAELNELEKEFVDYLIVNGITADAWVRIKEEEQEKAEDIVTLFSDVILEGVLRKIRFLEHRTKNDIKVFQCLDKKMVLVGMTSTNDDVDFTDPDFFETAGMNPPEGVKVYTAEKVYTKERELELFGMIQDGCSISNGQSFKAISLALV